VVDPLFRLAMLFTLAGPIPPRLASLAAAWIPCIKQFWHRKMRASEANAVIGERREQWCPEPVGNPSQCAASARGRCPCANSATQIRHTSRWQRAPRDCAGPADLLGRMSPWRLDSHPLSRRSAASLPPCRKASASSFPKISISMATTPVQPVWWLAPMPAPLSP
jgi:hypothetical protein